MKVIGFANKFYTLWEVTEETRKLGNGRSYLITNFVYIKNISLDRETAMAKYPGVEINEELKGHTQSWSKTTEIWDNVDTFRFGKYSGENIKNHFDTKYLEWYWNNTSGDHQEYVGEELKSRGYEIRIINYSYKDYYSNKMIEKSYAQLITPEELEAERNDANELNTKLEKIKNSNEVFFTPESNPDEDGNLIIGNITYHFEDVKENYYQGYSYYLPVIKGKAKRIKNKNVKITEFDYVVEDGKLKINIKNFEICK